MESGEGKELRRELDTLFAVQAGQTALLTAMIQTHPRYEDMQLATTAALELMLAAMPAQAMSEPMREKARLYVEQLQAVRAAAPGAHRPRMPSGR